METKGLKSLILNFEKTRIGKKDHYGSLEALRKSFVRDFSEDNIRNLKIEYYVQGKRENNQTNRSTFCYRIENETKELGDIH